MSSSTICCCPVNAADDEGYTALHAAAFTGQQQIVELLIAHGAAINAVAGHGITPRALAAREKQAAIVEILDENGATP